MAAGSDRDETVPLDQPRTAPDKVFPLREGTTQLTGRLVESS